MKIGIDARFYGSIGKGLGRYTQKLIEYLEEVDAENEYYIFLRKENFNEYEPTRKNFTKILADYRWYSFAEQIFFPIQLLRMKIDIMHFPHFNVPIFYWRKKIITIHDLILIHFPTLRNTTLNPIYYWIKFLAYKIVIGIAIRTSTHVVTVSNFTKSDILKHYNIPSEKISVTHEACEISNANVEISENDILQKYGIIKPYILYVGNAYPHKNLDFLIRSFKELKKGNEDKELQLVLVGKKDYFYNQLKIYAEKEKVQGVNFAGFIPDEYLNVVYKNAETYVFPSLYEGFGLPPLEAMSRNIPVISSDHPCMKEILGNSALYSNASDPQVFARDMRSILHDELLKEKLIKSGAERVQNYSWRRMARETLAIYKKQK